MLIAIWGPGLFLFILVVVKAEKTFWFSALSSQIDTVWTVILQTWFSIVSQVC